jgi:hypothetical protein
MIIYTLTADILDDHHLIGVYSSYNRAETEKLLVLLQQKIQCTIKPFILDREYGGPDDTKN